MVNWVEAVSILAAIVVAVAFLLEGRIRQEYKRVLYFAVWGYLCVLMFGQPYVRAPIRVGLGLVAVAIMTRVLVVMIRREQQKA